MCRNLMVVLLLLLIVKPNLFSADLFGDQIDWSGEQAAYESLFLKEENAAKSSKDKLQFAIKLKDKLMDEDYQHMHNYLCKHIPEIIDRNKSFEASLLRLAVFDIRYQDEQLKQSEEADLLELLAACVKQAPKDQQEQYMQRLLQARQLCLRRALRDGDMQTAAEHGKILSKWYKKSDKQRYGEYKRYMSAIKDRQRSEKKFESTKASVVLADKDTQEAFFLYCLETKRLDDALQVAQRLQDKHATPGAMAVLSVYGKLQKQTKELSAAEASAAVLYASLCLQRDDLSDFARCALYNLSLAAYPLIKTDPKHDKQVYLQAKLAAEQWTKQLELWPALIEAYSSVSYTYGGFSRSSVSLTNRDRVTLLLPSLYFDGPRKNYWHAAITKDRKADQCPTFINGPKHDLAVWMGQERPFELPEGSTAVIVQIGQSAIIAHGDRIKGSAAAGIKLVYDKLVKEKQKIIFMTCPLPSELGNFQINEQGERFAAAKLMNEIVQRFCKDHKIPLIDGFGLSLKRYKQNPKMRYFEDERSSKPTPECPQLVSDAIRDFLGYAPFK